MLTAIWSTLLDADSDLAQEMTRDPYNFSFTNLQGKYNERILKGALLTNPFGSHPRLSIIQPL